MITAPRIEHRDAQPYVGIRAQVTMQELRKVLPPLWGEVYGWLASKGIKPAGALLMAQTAKGPRRHRFGCGRALFPPESTGKGHRHMSRRHNSALFLVSGVHHSLRIHRKTGTRRSALSQLIDDHTTGR
jgi:hypothetical protein